MNHWVLKPFNSTHGCRVSSGKIGLSPLKKHHSAQSWVMQNSSFHHVVHHSLCQGSYPFNSCTLNEVTEAEDAKTNVQHLNEHL